VYRLDGSYRWLLWYSNEVDGLYVENGRFPSFASSEALTAYGRALGLAIDTVEASVHDVDAVVQWLSRPSSVGVDSAELLAVWNLAQDAAASLGQNLADRNELSDRAYEKLFRRGGPQWIEHLDDPELTGDLTAEEIQRLAQVLGRGLDLFRGRISMRA
jgi:hypothetical protein